MALRIGFDITPLGVPQSGVGTYTANLLRELCRHSSDQIVPLIHRPLHAQGGAAGCAVPLRGGAGRLNKTVWMQAVLPWQLARLRLDVAHFTNSVAPLLAPCRTVVTIHDMTLWLFPEHHYGQRLLAMRPIVPLAARRASAIVTVSHSAKADIVRVLGVPADKVHVIHEAASPHFRPLPGCEVERVKRAYSLPDCFLLYVGTIEPRKNLVRLLEAFAGVRERARLPHALLLVGQRGWKDGPVFAAVERLGLGGAVRFLDHVSTADLAALYNGADALAFPSLYEGFGLPVVEAMACGTPVVTSANGSLGEVAGDAACFVEPTSVQSIADGLHAVLSDAALRDQLRHRGLARAAHFTWAAAARETRAVYEGVARRAGVRV